MISADILLKGLGGLAVVGGATTVGVFYLKQNKTEDLKSLAEKVGLVCSETPTETNGVVCSKKTDANVKVKRDSDSFDATSITGGKIKAYEDKTYNKGFKFVIEEGDVSGDNSKKLEEFETYEIKDENNNKELRLTKKTSVNAGIKKALGLPDDSKCDLPTTTTDEKTCDLDDAKFKKINFEGKGETGEAVSGTPKLKISKLENTDTDFGTYKFKFVLESDQDSKISKTVTIKANTNTEFKIKANPATGGTKTLTLEKAWSLANLGAKVGLKECGTGSNTPKECGFDASKINLFNDANTHAKNASLSTDDTNKKIKAEEDQPGYNQGFKFYVTDADLALNNGNNGKKIHKKESNADSPTYEIKEQSPSGGTKGWYLTKKTTTPGGGGA